MAIVSLNGVRILPRLRQTHRQRHYARFLQERWQQLLPWRVMPALANVPFPITSASQPNPTSISAALTEHSRMQLVGGLGSGKSWAIQQLIHGWISTQQRLPGLYPLLIHVPTVAGEPDDVLINVLADAGFETDRLEVERGLASGKWLLILDDWEHASVPARTMWKYWLEDILVRYPALAAIVTTDTHEPVWTEFTRWELAPITPELIHAWLQVLLPDEEPDVMLAPLLNDDRTRLAAERLTDLAVLAYTYPTSGFPANRARLYMTALEKILRTLGATDVPRIKHALGVLGLQWLNGLAADVPEAFQPAIKLLNGLITLHNGKAWFTSTNFALFCAAMYCASNNYWEIAATHPQYWHELAPLAAGLMTDPAPLYAAVRGKGKPNAEQTLLLGECLRQHHVPLPTWSTAIIGALAQLNSKEPQHARSIDYLLDHMTSVVNATIAEQTQRGIDGERWCIALLRLLPSRLALPHLLEMMVDSRLQTVTRITAQQHLQNYDPASLVPLLKSIVQRPLDEWGRLLSSQLLAQSGAHGRKIIEQHIAHGKLLFPLHPTNQQANLIVALASDLLTDPQLDSTTHTIAAVALKGCASEQTAPILLQACVAGAASLREAAQQALLSSNHGLAVRGLGRLVLGDDIHWAARYEALQTLFMIDSPAASALLIRVIASNIPLAARIEAARVVLQRNSESAERIVSLIQNEQLHPSLRAALVSLTVPSSANLPHMSETLIQLCCGKAMSPLRARVLRAMSGCTADEVLAILAGIVEHEREDLESMGEAIQALGTIGDESGVWALRTILLGELNEQLRRAWEATLKPYEREMPPIEWNVDALPETMQWRWGAALANGLTSADPPSSLDELVAREVQWLHTLAAHSLGAIGGTAARTVLNDTLAQRGDENGFSAYSTIAQTLEEMDGGRTELATTLTQTQPPLYQVMQAQALERHAGSLTTLQPIVTNKTVTTQTRSAMLVALGHDPNIVPMLETMITDVHAPLQLRMDAIRSVSSINVAHLEGLLLSLLSNSRDEPTLQIAALDTLQAPASEATINAVRQILRDPRPPIEVAAAALRCLVRLGNHESMALFLRYAQSESPTLAIPAIDGLMLMSDQTAIAMLNRLAHSGGKSTRIRLHAIGTLLKLEGDVHVPLVRQMLESGSIGIRLMALDILLTIVRDPAELSEYLERDTPLPIRLRLVYALSEHRSQTDLQLLMALLENEHVNVMIRCVALEALCAARFSPVLPFVENIARDATASLTLQRRAIDGLRHWRNEPTTLLALSSLAESSMPFVRSRALSALVD